MGPRRDVRTVSTAIAGVLLLLLAAGVRFVLPQIRPDLGADGGGGWAGPTVLTAIAVLALLGGSALLVRAWDRWRGPQPDSSGADTGTAGPATGDRQA